MRYGHTASICHYRFDKNWITLKSISGQPQPQVHLTEQPFEYDPIAYMAQSILDFGDDQGWFMDTGATNHISINESPIDSSIPYGGTETMAVGNGKKLQISRIDKASLSSTTSYPLILNSVLQVPSITTNLISVS